MKYIFLISLLAGVFNLFISCKEEQRFNIITLVDLSSSRDSSVKEWYKQTIGNSIIKKMGQKDRFTLLPVDFYSLTASSEIFRLDMAKNDYSNEFAGLGEAELKMRSHQDSLTAAVREFNDSFEAVKNGRRPRIEGTDIFGALRQAKKYKKPGYKNVLFILSDMLQYSDKINFEDHLTKDYIDHYLDIAMHVDLTGIEIIVLTGRQEASSETFKIAESFWQKYFSQCGASLLDYSSEGVAKLEELFAPGYLQ